jgi:hypothetical protein
MGYFISKSTSVKKALKKSIFFMKQQFIDHKRHIFAPKHKKITCLDPRKSINNQNSNESRSYTINAFSWI